MIQPNASSFQLFSRFINWSNISIALLLIGVMGCQNGAKNGNNPNHCKYGEPVAIFDAKIPGISKHTFISKGQTGEETVKFDSGKELTLIQSGCNDIRQELQFNLPSIDFPNDTDFWIQKAIMELTALSQLNKKLAAFSMWASMIQSQKSDIHLAESFALSNGFYVQIDRIPSSDHFLLIIVLSDHPD